LALSLQFQLPLAIAIAIAAATSFSVAQLVCYAFLLVRAQWAMGGGRRPAILCNRPVYEIQPAFGPSKFPRIQLVQHEDSLATHIPQLVI